MTNPFDLISDAFAPQYRVNLSIERLDGSIVLTLSNDDGVAAKRLISKTQRNDPVRLQQLIESIRFGLAIDQGDQAVEMLAALASPRAGTQCRSLPSS